MALPFLLRVLFITAGKRASFENEPFRLFQEEGVSEVHRPAVEQLKGVRICPSK